MVCVLVSLSCLTMRCGRSRYVIPYAPGLHLVYLQSEDATTYHVYYAVSADLTTPPASPRLIDNLSTSASSPMVAVDSDHNPHIVWIQDVSGVNHVMYSRSSNRGVTFSTPIQIDTGNTNAASNPQIDVSSTGVPHIVWIQSDGTWNSIYYTRSTDFGTTFSTPLAVDDSSQRAAYFPQVFSDTDGNPHITFCQTFAAGAGSYYRHSLDGGASFQNLVATGNPASVPTSCKSFLRSDKNTFTAWGEIGGPTDFAYYTSNQGSSFGSAALANSGVSISEFDITSSTAGYVYTTFLDSVGAARLKFQRSTDGGVSFQAAITVDNGAQNCFKDQVLVDASNNPHILFSQTNGGVRRLFYNRSTNQGASFAGAVRLDNGLGAVLNQPWMRIDANSTIHVIWQETNTQKHIYYRQSTDLGVSFGSISQVDTGFDSTNPFFVSG
jgi:hypothetical protein